MYYLIDENQVSEELVNDSQNSFENMGEEDPAWWAGDIDTDEGSIPESGYQKPVSDYSGERTGVALSAQCSADPSSGYAPLDVQFEDLSIGYPTKWIWAIDDGRTFYEQNPRVHFENPGTYTVFLRVSNEYGSDSAGMAIEVLEPKKSTPEEGLIPDFMYYIDGNTLPMKVVFKDLSTGKPTMWRWYFGDGTESYVQNPVHYYNNTGVYKVKFVVENIYDGGTKSGDVAIAIYKKQDANFDDYKIVGKQEVSKNYYPFDKVYFVDKSTGTPSEWLWTFGDGTVSNEQNTTHIFNSSGFHVVELIVRNYLGQDSIEAYILVGDPKIGVK